MRDIALIMGMDESENSSKTLDFFAFCNTNISAGITQDDDVDTIPATTSVITETTASNDATQGKFQISRHQNLML